jgi:CDP-paratose 2-epimerase
MGVAIVTGSAGLVGSACARELAAVGLEIAGIDNDMRRVFFGDSASTAFCRARLERELPGYRHFDADVRDVGALDRIFAHFGSGCAAVIHTAAQPSHDWSARDPLTDFAVNAQGTLNLLEATRRHCPAAAFVFVSTNKVYGDLPNQLPLEERETRWELPDDHRYGRHGIDESLSIDQSLKSPFGASKAAADLMVQEYGRYFGLRTGVFRGGCLTGPDHSGAELHGFLAYLVRCAVTGTHYTIYGHHGKQVRDNIHAEDLARAFRHFVEAPRCGEVYNIGGGRFSNCSMLEAVQIAQELSGRELDWHYSEPARQGDHVWWITDLRKFRSHYPDWAPRHDLRAILAQIHDAAVRRYRSQP